MAGLKKTRVRRALAEFMRFYENLGIDPRKFPGFARSLRSPISEAFLQEGSTYPTVKSIMGLKNDEVEGSVYDNINYAHDVGFAIDLYTKQTTYVDPNYRDTIGRLLVTPYDPDNDAFQVTEENVEALQTFVNTKEALGITGQGWRAPNHAAYYSVLHDCLPNNIKEAIERQKTQNDSGGEVTIRRETPVHVIQSFDPTESPQGSDGDIVTFLLSGIPTVEWTRCVPYFEMIVLDPAFAKEFSPDSMMGHIGIGDQLGYAKFNFEKKLEEKNPDFAMAGAMEMFTMPQTLVAGTPLYTSQQGANPFAPLMTIESLSINYQGILPRTKKNVITRVPAKEMTAELRIKVHDKARLNQVLPFFRPGGTSNGTTSMAITFGWSHPDGERLAQRSTEEYGGLLGDVLNAARVTNIFKTADMNYQFTDTGEVDLTLSLACGPMNELLENATIAAGESVSSTELSQVLDSTVDMIEMMTAAGGGGTRLSVGNSYIAALKDELKHSKDLEKKLKALRAKMTAEGFRRWTRRATIPYAYSIDSDGDGIADQSVPASEYVGYSPSEATEAFYDITTGDGRPDFSKYSELSDILTEIFGENSAAAGRSAAARSNSSKIVEQLMNDLCKGPDPFLRPRPHNFPNIASSYTFRDFSRQNSKRNPRATNKYVSLGKVFLYFASPTLMDLQGVEEVQFVFHVFNMDAAGVWAHNISQFPIPTDDLKKKIKALVKEKGNLKLRDFLSFVIENYVNDNTMQRTHAFGLKSVKNSSRSKRLHQLYGDTYTSEKITPDLKVPNVQFKITQKPARETLFESQLSEDLTAPHVLRIEVYDENCSASPFHESATATPSGAIKFKTRNEDRRTYDTQIPMAYTVTREDGELQAVGVGSAKSAIARHNYYYLSEIKFHAMRGTLQDGDPPDLDKIKAYLDPINAEIKERNKGLSQSNKKKEIKPEEFKKLLMSYLYLSDSFFNETDRKTITELSGRSTAENRFKYTLQESAGAKLIFGAENSSVIKMSLQTTQDKNARNLALLDARESVQRDSDSAAGIGRLPLKIVPGTLEIECYGNPFIGVGQEIFVDMGTNTGLDGLYRVLKVSHDIRPGEYVTKATLHPGSTGPAVVDSRRSLFDFIAATLGADFLK